MNDLYRIKSFIIIKYPSIFVIKVLKKSYLCDIFIIQP